MTTNKPLFLLLFLSYAILGSLIFLTHFLSPWLSFGFTLIGIWLTTRFVSLRIINPLSNLQEIAENLAKGEFKNQFPWSESREIAHLVTAISNMATQLEDRFKTILQERNEKEAILGSMTDGVITIDLDEKIKTINASAAALLEKDRFSCKDITLLEAIRNTDLQRLIRQLLHDPTHPPLDTILTDPNQKNIQIQGTPLLDSANQVIGALIVLHDLTPIKQFDAIRKDFVANVSHELKTPITLIKGSIETLEDLTLSDTDRNRFLSMAKSHTNRLDQILEDLLILARLEQGKTEVITEEVSLSELFQSAIRLCQPLLEEKKISIQTEGDTSLSLDCNKALVEQALINLIKNAIQYSNTPRILLHASANETTLCLTVQDFGNGIDSEHLPRLFERFYRVDKGRARQSGGTGLGLALVKHIIQAHHGQVDVQSEKGKGTTFILTFPIKNQKTH